MIGQAGKYKTNIFKIMKKYVFAVFYLCLAWAGAFISMAYAQVVYPPVPNSGIDNQVYGFAQLNGGEFGNGAGSNQNPNGYALNVNLNDVANSPSITTTDTECNALYKLSYEVYDIDYDGEVRVYLNNVYLAFITATGEALTARRKIEFCGSLLRAGNNLIEFRVENSSRVWSVKDIMLKYMVIDAVNLNENSNSSLAYGNGFGTNNHPNYLVVNFDNTQDGNQVLSVRGWDTDLPDEVSVYLNDNLMGRLTQDCNLCVGDVDQFELSSDLFLSGSNQLLFLQRNSNEQWGVTGIVLRPKSTIAPIIDLLLL